MVSVYAILFYTILGLSLGYLGLKIYPKINRTIGGNKPIVSIIVSMLMMFSIFIPFIIATIGASFWWIFTFILLMPYIIIKAWNNYSNVAPFIAILTILIPVLYMNPMAQWWEILSPIIFSGLLILVILPLMINASGGNMLDLSWIKAFLPLGITSMIAILATSIFDSLASAFKMETGWRWMLGLISIVGFFFSYLIGKGDGNFFVGWEFLGNSTSQRWKTMFKFIFLLGLPILYGWSSLKYFENYNQYYNKIPGGFTALLWILNSLIFLSGVYLLIFFLTKFFVDDSLNISNWRRIIGLMGLGRDRIGLNIALIISLFVIIGLIFFCVRNPNASIIVMQIILGLIVFYSIFKYLISHPRILELITQNTFLRLLFDILFVIPCMFYYLFEQNDLSISKTTIIVFIIELIILFAYVLLPMFRKWFYLWTPFKRNNSLSKEKRIQTANQSAYNAKEDFKKATQIPSPFSTTPFQVPIDASGIEMWKEIYKDYDDKYKPMPSDTMLSSSDIFPPNKQNLINYLKTQNFKSTFLPLNIQKNKIITKIFGPPADIPSMADWIRDASNNPTNLEDVMDKLQKFVALTKMANNLSKDDKDDKDAKYDSFDSKILLNKPVRINNPKYLGQFENLHSSINTLAQNAFNYNYGLSLWLYILPQGSEYGVGYSKDTKVFDYAGKPTILFNPDKNLLKISVQTGVSGESIPAKRIENIVYKTNKFKMQKWNNIFINCFGATLDIFINNKLVAHVNNVIPYMAVDSIVAGDKNGISGAISAIAYFSQPISRSKMTLLYNSLVNKNPPTI